VVLAAGLYGLLPRLAGLSKAAAALRHTRPGFVVAGVVAEAVSLVAYILFFRRVLRAVGAPLPFRTVARVTMAAFLLSHVSPWGSATGTLLNVDALREEGVDPATTAEAVALTTLLSSLALVALLLAGLGSTLGKHSLPSAYLASAVLGVVLIMGGLAGALAAAYHPSVAEEVGRRVGRLARRVRSSLDSERVASGARRLATLARSVLSGRPFVESIALALGDLLTDSLALYCFFLAVGYRPNAGAVLVAYGAANILSAIPITPGGLGVVEVTLVAVSIAFGAPRHIAILTVLGYRLVNFWLPLPIGAAAYVIQRVRSRSSARLPPATS
jgi:uncharacterized protein (TIRG00374 family)